MKLGCEILGLVCSVAVLALSAKFAENATVPRQASQRKPTVDDDARGRVDIRELHNAAPNAVHLRCLPAYKYGYCVRILQLSGQQLRVDANGVGSRKKAAHICTSFPCIAASPGTGMPAYDSDAADCAIESYLRYEYRWLLQTLNRSCSL